MAADGVRRAGGAGRLIATALERAAGLQELGCGAARFATPSRQPGDRRCLKGPPVGSFQMASKIYFRGVAPNALVRK